MTTIILNRANARLFVDAALSAASADDITPVLCGAHISVDGERLRVTSTDRYRVHTAVIGAVELPAQIDAIIPREALLWLKRNAAHFGSHASQLQRITLNVEPHVKDAIKTEPGALRITIAEHSEPDAASVVWNGRHTVGNFPPVLGLIETARGAEAITATPRLNLAYVGKVNQLVRQLGQSVRVKFTAGGKPNKPGPAYFAVEDYKGAVVAEALIQPHLEREEMR